jgi:hypothetical protein
MSRQTASGLWDNAGAVLDCDIEWYPKNQPHVGNIFPSLKAYDRMAFNRHEEEPLVLSLALASND